MAHTRHTRPKIVLPSVPQLSKPQTPKPPGPLQPLRGLQGLKNIPGPRSTLNLDDELGPESPSTLTLLLRAIDERLVVIASYDSKQGVQDHEFFPLEIGERDGRHRVWAYQVAGDTKPGWKCFRVAGLSAVATREGEWAVPDVRPDTKRCFGAG